MRCHYIYNRWLVCCSNYVNVQNEQDWSKQWAMGNLLVSVSGCGWGFGPISLCVWWNLNETFPLVWRVVNAECTFFFKILKYHTLDSKVGVLIVDIVGHIFEQNVLGCCISARIWSVFVWWYNASVACARSRWLVSTAGQNLSATVC